MFFYIYEDYLQITLRAFLAQLASLVLMFVFVKTPDDYAVYALITVLASGGSYIFNYIYAGKYYRPRLTPHCNLKKHIVPMLVLAANTFAVTIYVNSDTTMIGFFLDDHHVGLYSTAVKVYNIVKHVMAAVIASATPRISFYYHNGEKDRYHNLMTKMAQVLLIVALPAMVGLFMTSEDVILVIAGNEYINSASALAILSFALLFATFGSYGATYGFLVLSDTAEFVYKCTDVYDPISEGGVPWNDPDIAVEWPEIDVPYKTSEKDEKHEPFKSQDFSWAEKWL